MKLPALVTAACLAAGGLIAVAPGGSAAVEPAARTVKAVDWGRCGDPTLRLLGGKCGFVNVPLDYSHPRGKKIRLAVSRVRHTVKASKYQGVMLLNPGGPGASGLGLSVLGPVISEGFQRRDVGGAYDWIGFDPRGVGESRPSLSCDPNYFGPDRPEYVPSTPELLQVWQERSAGYARACGRAGGRLLDNMRTTDAARDVDEIRKALGATRINYYGFSYGTYLAQVYTELFPQRMRRMVLDSNVDPRRVWYRANLDQDIAFDRNLGLFFGWVARHDDTYHLGATRAAVRQRYTDVHHQLAATPIDGKVGPDEWDDIFLDAGYAQFIWPDLADLFADWVATGDGAPVVEAYQDFDAPGDDNSYAVYTAVSCVDDTWKDEDFLADQWRTHAKAPFFTWGNAWFNAPCNYWPARGRPHTRVTGRGVGTALLVGETLDAATPFTGSRYLRSIFKQSRLVAVVGGASHAVSPGGSACADRRIFDYLATGRLPDRKSGHRLDVRCPAPPQPRPTQGSGQTLAAISSLTFARAAQAGDPDAGRALVARILVAAARP